MTLDQPRSSQSRFSHLQNGGGDPTAQPSQEGTPGRASSLPRLQWGRGAPGPAWPRGWQNRLAPAGPRRPVSMAARPAYLPAGSRPWLQPRRSDLAEIAVAAALAAARSRCDLFSGRAGGSEAHADPPPPGLPAARLPLRPLNPTPAPVSRELHFPGSRALVGDSSRQWNYISRNDLQCAGASMRYGACCNLVAKAPDPGLHFPGGPAARMSRKAVAHGAATFARPP